ncbi:DUF4276 family protein [Verminephrobacter aporrectodeae subsp. tuberculatae]|uniref:DUF4276 family protein n=1 Tax=Verminephrobacter aporrectodeae TaxID=1110389 RepID=UPI002244932D|nr:DUF4276 family protein [Verminephrobacter aporrectodeae]MCW8198837.1 DUF4276 family protein [Verminephrobacter aporrectodeae subsp. tuberculatae]
MRELVFLLEEASAKALLEGLLPRILDHRILPRLIAFDGKQDLEKQLVRRLRSYLNPDARFLVLRDQDSAPDCIKVKKKLTGLCATAGRQAVSLVRIACRELESMYLADLRAVEIALAVPGLAKRQSSAKFRHPDRLESPGRKLAKLANGEYQKISGSRLLGRHLDTANERSASFRNLVRGIRRLETELLEIP